MTKYDKGWIVCQLMIEQSDSTNPQFLRAGGQNPESKIAPNFWIVRFRLLPIEPFKRRAVSQ